MLHQIIPIALGDAGVGAVSGSPGELRLLPISILRVDDSYQRAINSNSVRVISRICAEFDWSKFLPVIVVREGSTFSVVDGQHRTTAALTLGISEVPCYVLSCTAEEAAAAFAAINGNVTPVGPVDIWFAEVAAKKPETLAVKRSLDAAGVSVVRKKDGFRVGETRSINVLRRAYDFYGESMLITILQCITECGDGNPGMIFGAMIHGIGRAIRTKPEYLANPSRIFDVFDALDLAEILDRARVENAQSKNPLQFILTRNFNAALGRGAKHAA